MVRTRRARQDTDRAVLARRAVLAAGLALAACAAPWAGRRFDPPPPDPERIARDVAWLADDAREGRGVGTAGLEAAADYLSEAFRAAGFAPGAPGGGYLQPLEMPVSIRVVRQRASVGGVPLTPGEDFAAFLSSADGSVDTPIVFVGYGITAPELDYDDYAGIDLAGRAALVIEDRPESARAPVAGPRGAPFLRRAYKVANARRHGAAAVLIAPAVGDRYGLPGNAGREAANPTIQAGEALVLAVSRRSAEAIMARGGGPGLDARQGSIDATGQPASAPLEVSLRAEVRIERRRARVHNVLALRPGSDPSLRRETVVIGAHYDHLGHGEFGSMAPDRRGEIHNGADDNASGTAGLLELARAFAGAPPTRRTLVLAAFTGEEAGLVGSAYYVRHPARPLADTVAMLNLDMIGRLAAGGLTVFGVETSPGFSERVARAAEGLPLEVEATDGGYAPSDQTSFYAKNIPVLSFFTGAHTDYHTPDDDAARIDGPGEAQVLLVVERVARALLDAEQRPVVRTAEAPAMGPGGGGYGPYLGTVPDFGGNAGRGVLLQGVRPGSPAEVAGIRAEDRIVEFDGAPVANLEDFAALLFASRPGRRVPITVLRDGRQIETEAILGQRR